MANIFKPKRSSTLGAVPTTQALSDGELAVNSANKKIYLREGNNIIALDDAGTLNGLSSASFLQSESDTLATVTARGATTSTAVTLSSFANHYSGHLYYDAHDINGNHYPHFLDGSNGTGTIINWRLFNGTANTIVHYWRTDYTSFSNSLRSTVDVRAPIFYDTDNTDYYVNPAGTSNIRYLKINTSGTSSATRVLTIKAEGQGEIDFGSYPASWTSALQIQNNNNTDIVWISPLDDGYNARFRTGGCGLDFYTDGTSTDGGTLSAFIGSGSVRSPIFYDTDNTDYYANLADTGNAINIAGSLRAATYNKPAIMTVASGSDSTGASIAIQQETAEGWTAIFADFEPYTGWGLYHDNPNNYFSFTSENSTGSIRSFTVPSRSSGNRTAHEKFRIDQNNGDFITGRDGYAQSSFRAPIFYDSNDTNYYINPAGTSILSSIDLRSTSKIQTAGFAGFEYYNTVGGNWEGFIGTENNTGNLRYNSRLGTHTFYNNSSAIVIFNSTGVGISTTNPADTLEVFSANYRGLTLKTTTGSNRPTLSFLNESGGGIAYIQSINKEIAIGRANSDYGGHSETVRFTDSGNIGIGVTNPLGKLSAYTTSINGATDYNGQNFGIIVGKDNGDNLYDEGNGIVFTQQYAPDSVDSAQIRVGAIVGYKGQATGNFGGGLKFKVQPTGAVPMVDAMVLTKDGNLGVGATIPSYKLDVSGSIRASVTGGGTGLLLHVNTGWSASANFAQFWTGQTNGFAFYANSNGDGTNELLRVGSDGNVTATTSLRAPIFYDLDDTAYKLDATSTANDALRIRGGTLHGPNVTWGKYLHVGGDGRNGYIDNADVASVSTTNGNLHIDAASSYYTYLNYYDGSGVYFGNGSSAIVAEIASNGTFRSPVYYDYNDTNYYVDAASTSVLSTLNNLSWVRIGGAAQRSAYGLTVGFTDNTTFASNSDASDSSRIISVINESTTVNAMSVLGFRINPNGNSLNAMMDMKFVNTGATNTSTLHFSFNHGGGFSDRVTFKSDGNVGINSTSPTEKLDVVGVVKATDFNTTSDERLKTNISTIENSLEKVSQIRGVNFEWKDGNRKSAGVIAQEIEKVLPELVRDNGTKTVNYNGLIGVLIEAIKELSAEIDTLKEMRYK